MPYSIETKDGIVINNIPDDIPHDAPELKARVAQVRAGNLQSSQPKAPVAQPVEKPSVLENALSDVGNIVSGVAHTVAHPIDTASALAKAGSGELEKLTGGILKECNPQVRQQAKQSAEALNQYYANRYGSMEGFKKALQEHPVEVAADISTVLGGEIGRAHV